MRYELAWLSEWWAPGPGCGIAANVGDFEFEFEAMAGTGLVDLIAGMAPRADPTFPECSQPSPFEDRRKILCQNNDFQNNLTFPSAANMVYQPAPTV